MLASLTELKSYYVEGTDAEIGRVDDLCFREDEWIVPEVESENPDEPEEAGPQLQFVGDLVEVYGIQAEARRIHVSLSREAVVHSPIIASEEPITPELCQSLREYYDQYSR